MKRTLRTAIAVLLFFALTTIHALAFSDVAENDWFYENVTDMTNSGYLKGYEDGSFRPYGTITKAEFVAIVSRISNLSPSASEVDHWASGLMQSALTQGYYDWDEIPPSSSSFNESITRQLAFKIVMNAFLPQAAGRHKDISRAPDFSDLDGRLQTGS